MSADEIKEKIDEELKKMFAKNFRTLRFFKDMNQTEVANLIGVSQQTIACWENCKATPNLVTLHTIADKFNVSVDYLLGRQENDLGNILSDEQIALLNAFSELDIVNRQKVLGYMEGLCHEQKRNKKVKSLTSPSIFRRKKFQMKG